MLRVLDSLADINPDDWNSLALRGNPFVRHEFLHALEYTGCAANATGWQAQHLILRDDAGRLLGAAPLYLKSHSWGEFVFDFSWANAYARLGLQYYPKLVNAIPFTPATGPRLLTAPDADGAAVRAALLAGMRALAQEHRASSIHMLFAADDDQHAALAQEFLPRQDCQFHWRNRGYATFDDFIATFRAEKRKKLLRERRRVREAGIVFERRNGAELSLEDWRLAFALSANTFAQRGHEHYLNVEFFCAIARQQPDSVVVIWALHGDDRIAVAICFRGADTLYGRYWGAAQEYHSLHFETCYLQGVEYCIENGLQRFEPGTQGEHKIARGFEPAYTHSAHWIADHRVRAAIAEHVKQEARAVERYADSVNEHLPFHRATRPT